VLVPAVVEQSPGDEEEGRSDGGSELSEPA
jgi:hypothetical protein